MSFVFQPREYQAFASTSVFSYYEAGHKGHPVIAMPTGTGKSVIIADIVIQIMQAWPGQRLLILCPTKELVLQNVAKLLAMWPGAPVGVCSASLNRYDTGQPIIFGTIGTVINRCEAIGRRDMVFVDECHLVSDKDETQYRKYIDFLLGLWEHTKVVGLSATPYRLGLGHITDGGLFTDVCCDATGLDAFNWFIDQGYLVPLIPRPTGTRLSTKDLKTSGGEYTDKSQQLAYDKESITQAVVDEARELAHDRAKILIFCTGIDHAENIKTYLEALGETAVAVHSKSATRDEDLAAFQTMGDNGVRWCVNYGVLTTGFDMPGLDCIAVVRVTKSPGLWVQILGRGTRADYAPGFDLTTQEGRLLAISNSAKQNCLVLDFGYNTATLGPINDPKLPKKKGEGGGVAPVKTCKADNTVAGTGDDNQPCGIWNHPSARTCVFCGAEFRFDVKFEMKASNDQVLAGAYDRPVVNEYEVKRVTYERHSKLGRPDSIHAYYYSGLRRFGHYICPEHGGIPTRKAQQWWQAHGGGTMPPTTAECLLHVDSLTVPAKIRVWENKKYPDIIDWIFHDPAANLAPSL